MSMLPKNHPASTPATPRIDYLELDPRRPLDDDVLFAVGFGAQAPTGARRVRVPLEPLAGAAFTEVWRAQGAVISGEAGAIRFSSDDHYLAGVIELRESDGLVATTTEAYHAIAQFQERSAFPHLLRTWNYFDAINEGDGDSERYRGFCSGRVAGLRDFPLAQHPAATVIGRRDGERVLQVYWLAGREPGVALENPRQVSAFRYPREYGQTSPTFSRSMLVNPSWLLVSGTASIVGHASQHPGDTAAQVGEILTNLDSLLARAHAQAPALPRQLGRGAQLKVYLRRREDLEMVSGRVRPLLPAGVPLLVLLGDVCRAELLVEFDCVVTGD